MKNNFYPNWTYPLKIRNWHFEAFENAIDKSIRNSIELNINAWDYGLFSNDQGTTLDIEETDTEIIIKKCQAILPSGQLIYINETVSLLSTKKEDINNDLGFSAKEGWLAITILEKKKPFGERDDDNFGHGPWWMDVGQGV